MAGLSELERLGVSGPAAANWLRSLDDILSRMLKPDLIWSVRKFRASTLATRVVFTRSCWDRLNVRSGSVLTPTSMDRAPSKCWREEWMNNLSLKVILLLNIQRQRGDTSSADALVRRFADRFWTTDWPEFRVLAFTTIRGRSSRKGLQESYTQRQW